MSPFKRQLGDFCCMDKKLKISYFFVFILSELSLYCLTIKKIVYTYTPVGLFVIVSHLPSGLMCPCTSPNLEKSIPPLSPSSTQSLTVDSVTSAAVR